MKIIHRTLVVGCSLLALSACGADDIASPGTGGNITINNTTNNPAPTPTPTPTSALVTPAGGCPTIANPTQLTDAGTVTGPTGTWRVCSLPATFTASSTLPKVAGLLYQLPGRVNVGADEGFSGASGKVTLTIEPGVIVYGGVGTSWLAVNRGNKIHAVGSANLPIIFTSRDNVLGLNTENSSGQWGGVVLLGRGKITDCNYGSVGAGTCERDTEGAVDPAIFGGADDTYNAGELAYVQIRYSGYVLSADKELQSLTLEGVGSGTTIHHFQSFNSSDDGSETFGGSPNMKYYISVGAEDDSIDVDTGARLNIQYAIAIQRPNAGDAILEIDSNGNEADTPRVDLKISNFTFLPSVNGAVSDNSDKASFMFRGNSDTKLYNGILVSPNNECMQVYNHYATFAAKSVVMQCAATKYIDGGDATAGTAAGFFGSGSNNNNDGFTPTLTSLFIDGTNEAAVAAFDAHTISTFFDTTTYIGAVKDAADTWYAGWTCNASFGNFGTGNSGNCTSIPTI